MYSWKIQFCIVTEIDVFSRVMVIPIVEFDFFLLLRVFFDLTHNHDNGSLLYSKSGLCAVIMAASVILVFFFHLKLALPWQFPVSNDYKIPLKPIRLQTAHVITYNKGLVYYVADDLTDFRFS